MGWWNKKSTQEFPNSALFNAICSLQNLQRRLQQLQIRKNQNLLLPEIKRKPLRKKPDKIFEYSEKNYMKKLHTYSPSTYKIYKSQLTKFKAFVNDDSIMFDDITVSL